MASWYTPESSWNPELGQLELYLDNGTDEYYDWFFLPHSGFVQPRN